MYGLPQAGLLAQQRLIAHLAVHGYTQTPTPCLFRHATNGTVFTLVVDDFGIKYTSPEGANHLISTLKLLYDIKVDWSGTSYIGFTIAFDSTTKSVSLYCAPVAAVIGNRPVRSALRERGRFMI